MKTFTGFFTGCCSTKPHLRTQSRRPGKDITAFYSIRRWRRTAGRRQDHALSPRRHAAEAAAGYRRLLLSVCHLKSQVEELHLVFTRFQLSVREIGDHESSST